MKKAPTLRKSYRGRHIALVITRAGLLVVLSTIGIAFSSACGKKGPPFLPEKTINAKVDRLTGEWADGQIRLEGTIQGDNKHTEIIACRISHAWYPEDQPPCEGCPIQMTEFADTVETKVLGDRFTCVIPVVEKRGIWFIEIRLTDGKGAVGPPSDRIRINIGN